MRRRVDGRAENRAQHRPWGDVWPVGLATERPAREFPAGADRGPSDRSPVARWLQSPSEHALAMASQSRASAARSARGRRNEGQLELVPAVLDAQYADHRPAKRERLGKCCPHAARGSHLARTYCVQGHARVYRRARGESGSTHRPACNDTGCETDCARALARNLRTEVAADHCVVGAEPDTGAVGRRVEDSSRNPAAGSHCTQRRSAGDRYPDRTP